ncbi:MAG: (2Fe-2S)-binding protein [Rhodospirillaceae bacterium]|jgi:D-hydroxyproline dehydrogenase subunit gamma|nr:(2Fe-2S)-binding protein [Rhodospirillaceae bacterium]MBT3492841.1 (2Fe-2S)-binding protein [Rhodospirillaceae bacterium]MBT3779980.1 (2Fe-2S)-binding protein [Rhodospirillaceae bacterium]MBT3976692.1 (2Fe-2S)-binding protein [Rhodospirillaceae bacterium]MBT4169416.1 (2Fe-2S)-binding protein [Rhodospirillaceae bacterium]
MDRPLFRRMNEAGGEARLTIYFAGQPVNAKPGDSVAAALLAAGVSSFRQTPKSAAARGPFCMTGACFDCLLRIDGEDNRQGCMTPVREGMRIEAMGGLRPVDDDD